jgi:serine/threonine protein kinase
MLLYPVAVCDLHTFFDDAEAYLNNSPDDSQIHRLDQLGYFPDHVQTLKHKAWPIYSQIGCLVSAIAYLHNQSIRHKDLKPSNILLSKGRLYLSDFGNATDFSLLSRSATGDGGGTPMYFAPEVRTLYLHPDQPTF